METFEVALKDLPIKILLGVDSYKQNRNEKDTAFPMQTSICAIRSAKIAAKLEAWLGGI